MKYQTKCRFFGLLICAVIFFGCGGRKESKPAGSTPADGILKLTVDRPIFGGGSPQGTRVDTAFLEEAEKMLGLELDINWREAPWGDYNDRLSTLLAGGEYGDIFHVTGYGPQLMDMGEQGLIVNLIDYPEATKNYMDFVGQSPQQQSIYAADGGVYGFSMPQVSPDYITPLPAVNVTAFEENGWPVPTNLEELYEVAKQIKSRFPDSYPVIDFNYGGYVLSSVLINANRSGGGGLYFDLDEQKHILGAERENFRKAVEFARKLYVEGLYDPEAGTIKDVTEVEKRLLNRRSFIALQEWPSHILLLNKNDVSTDVFGWIPPLRGIDDQVPLVQGTEKGIAVVSGYRTIVNGETEYPELVTRLVDSQYSKKIRNILNWGIEGETFAYNEQGEPEFLDIVKKAAEPASVMAEYGMITSLTVRSGFILGAVQDNRFQQVQAPIPVYEDGEWTEENAIIFAGRILAAGGAELLPGFRLSAPIFTFSKEENKEISREMDPVSTFITEEVQKFVIGKRPMSEWEEFIVEMRTYGDYEKIIALHDSKM